MDTQVHMQVTQAIEWVLDDGRTGVTGVDTLSLSLTKESNNDISSNYVQVTHRRQKMTAVNINRHVWTMSY